MGTRDKDEVPRRSTYSRMHPDLCLQQTMRAATEVSAAQGSGGIDARDSPEARSSRAGAPAPRETSCFSALQICWGKGARA